MKKFASLVLTAVLLATMLCVFAVPAAALGYKKIYCDKDVIDEPVIMRNLLVEEGATVRLDSFFGLGPHIILGKDSTLIIGSNAVLATLDTTTEFEISGSGDNLPKIIVENGGELDLDFKSEENAKEFASIVQPPQDGTRVKWGTITREELANILASFVYSGSVLSEGTWWIIIAVAVLALGGVVTLVIVNKKKKPAVASGENTDEE